MAIISTLAMNTNTELRKIDEKKYIIFYKTNQASGLGPLGKSENLFQHKFMAFVIYLEQKSRRKLICIRKTDVTIVKEHLNSVGKFSFSSVYLRCTCYSSFLKYQVLNKYLQYYYIYIFLHS